MLHCAFGGLDARHPQLARLEIHDPASEWQVAHVYDRLGALLDRLDEPMEIDEFMEHLDGGSRGVMVIERPWLGSNARTVVQLGQVQGAVLTTAYAHRWACIQADPSTIRKQIIGVGTARGKGEIKRRVTQWVQAVHGLDVSEDAADAVVIWEYARWLARTSL